MTRCFCHKDLPDGQRTITIRLAVEWGDERGIHEKDVSFCSFRCVSEWAAGRAEQHDPKDAA